MSEGQQSPEHGSVGASQGRPNERRDVQRAINLWQRNVMEDGGAPLLAKWAEGMTGARPKTHFLRPSLVLPMLHSALRHAFAERGSPDYAAIQRRAA